MIIILHTVVLKSCAYLKAKPTKKFFDGFRFGSSKTTAAFGRPTVSWRRQQGAILVQHFDVGDVKTSDAVVDYSTTNARLGQR